MPSIVPHVWQTRHWYYWHFCGACTCVSNIFDCRSSAERLHGQGTLCRHTHMHTGTHARTHTLFIPEAIPVLQKLSCTMQRCHIGREHPEQQ